VISSTRKEKNYCPACKERTGLTLRGICEWCDTPLVSIGTGKRGVARKLSDDQVRALHVAHTRGASIRSLGERIYKNAGYSSAKSCANSISSAFAALGLQARDRIEATQKASTKHGRARRVPKDSEDYLRYRREMKVASGEVRGVQCESPRLRYPRKGERCRRPALAGSTFCFAHDPNRRDEILGILVKARS
jgi:hypothetical protein